LIQASGMVAPSRNGIEMPQWRLRFSTNRERRPKCGVCIKQKHRPRSIDCSSLIIYHAHIVQFSGRANISIIEAGIPDTSIDLGRLSTAMQAAVCLRIATRCIHLVV
jgi:hypothetical protein